MSCDVISTDNSRNTPMFSSGLAELPISNETVWRDHQGREVPSSVGPEAYMTMALWRIGFERAPGSIYSRTSATSCLRTCPYPSIRLLYSTNSWCTVMFHLASHETSLWLSLIAPHKVLDAVRVIAIYS